MKLRDFITRTLLDVVDGVAGAQENLIEGHGAISPTQGPHNPYQNIDFDLVIGAEENPAGEDHITVVRAATGDPPRSQRGDASRIQFTVPVRLPTMGR